MINTKSYRYWSIRIYYFLFLSAFSFIMPYLALFYRRQGMSGIQIGVLGTLSALIGLIFAPIWGRFSDRTSHPTRLLQVAFLGSAISYLFLSFQEQYYIIAIFACVSAFLISGIDPISDAMALRTGEADERAPFGSIRLWGSLGWALCVYFAGLLIERIGIRMIFWGYSGLIFLVVIVLNFIVLSQRRREDPNGLKSIPYIKLVMSLLKNPTLVGLAVSLSVLWFVRAGIFQFQAIYMSELGAVESMIGLVNTISALVELPSMLFADRLVNGIGAQKLIRISLILFTIQTGVIVILPKIGMFIVAAVLSGIAFSFFNVSLVVFVDELAPYAQTATVLALFSSTLRGVIQIIASLLSGFAFDQFGAYWLYVTGLIGCILALLIYQGFVIRKQQTMMINK